MVVYYTLRAAESSCRNENAEEDAWSDRVAGRIYENRFDSAVNANLGGKFKSRRESRGETGVGQRKSG